MRDITESGHYFTRNAVSWRLYANCPLCGNAYYHAFRCPESLLDWDQEIKQMGESDDWKQWYQGEE